MLLRIHAANRHAAKRNRFFDARDLDAGHAEHGKLPTSRSIVIHRRQTYQISTGEMFSSTAVVFLSLVVLTGRCFESLLVSAPHYLDMVRI